MNQPVSVYPPETHVLAGLDVHRFVHRRHVAKNPEINDSSSYAILVLKKLLWVYPVIELYILQRENMIYQYM